MSLGFIINNYLGPNGATLIAFGEVRFMMWATFATAVINIGLNGALIPLLGIVGAATASITALTSINLIRCWKLYSISRAQPLSKNLMKPTLISIIFVLVIYAALKEFITIWALPILFILFYVIYGFIVLFTKSFDQEDIKMLLAIEKKTGIDITFIKKTLQRFL